MPSRQKAIEREELARIFGHMVVGRVIIVPVVVALAAILNGLFTFARGEITTTRANLRPRNNA